MVTEGQISELKQIAAKLRWQIVHMMGPDKIHHFGGSLSVVEIVTALYFYKMRYDPQNPQWPERDRFIMSKGHSVPAQYAALGLLGVIPIKELLTLKLLGSRLQGHPAMHLTPGLEGCTGALGEGLSYANGMALAGRIRSQHFHVYCVIGDGELQEGQVWEAVMTAAKHRLNHLTAIIDRNKLKAMDAPESSKILEPLSERWKSFGWVVRQVDGHDIFALCEALDWADLQDSQPSLIIADTVKGKGIPFIEGQSGFHNAALSVEQYQQAIQLLNKEARITESVE